MTTSRDDMIPAYKGFNSDLTCRGFQYAEGETYQTDRAELCVTGFHACPMPLDTLRYYPLGTSVYHAVEVDADAHQGDDKVASKRIKIGGRMSLAELIKAHSSLAFKRANQAEGTDESPAVTSGVRSTAAASGSESTAATSGDESTAKVEGEHSIAVAGGYQCSAMGSLGCWLVIAERDDDGDEAWQWAEARANTDVVEEWVWDRGTHYRVDLARIKPYPCGPELDHHYHMGDGFVTRVPGRESDCPACTEPVEAVR